MNCWRHFRTSTRRLPRTEVSATSTLDSGHGVAQPEGTAIEADDSCGASRRWSPAWNKAVLLK